MSRAVFQGALARLVVDPDFRDGVRARGATVLPADLSELERRRLVAVAADRGLDITRTLHKGFRLGKILNQLPLTCALLGSDRLAVEIAEFWRRRLPLSFYFLEEAVAFCDHLLARARAGELAVAYLEEVVGYERAERKLKQSRAEGSPLPPLRVPFRHAPLDLLRPLSEGRVPAEVPAAACVLVAALTAAGGVEWSVEPGS
jgi:hypothetical protein